VDVNAGHLAVSVATPDGNVLSEPFTIPLELAGLPAAARDGHIRAAVTQLIGTAKTAGARSVVIENLDFKEAAPRGASAPGTGPRAANADVPSGAPSGASSPPGSGTASPR
jgi:hypothetical protein